MEKTLNVVDLFSGGGGGSVGIHRNKGFKTIFALDFWDKATETYKHNFKDVNVVCDDIHNLSEEKIKDLVGDNKIDIVIGGPPCQGFSMITRNNYERSKNAKIEMEKKNHLFLEFLRVVQILQPRMVVMENVVGILSMKNKEGRKIIDDIIKAYDSIGYHMKYKLVDISKLGLPQTRKRVIFIASKEKELVDKFVYPDEIYNIDNNIGDAISDLSDDSKYIMDYNKTSDYIKTLRDKKNLEYNEQYHKPKNKELYVNRLKEIKPGENMSNLPENNPYKTKAKFTNAYRRYKFDEKVGTIINIAKTVYIHPTKDRIFSIREVARLQNFPDSYEFITDFTPSHNYQILANAIPPILTEKIFKEIKRIW